MTKTITIALIILSWTTNIFAQEQQLYNPAANAAADIEAAIKKAATENKFVLIQAGGNWCGWCKEFARIASANPGIDSIIDHCFITYHLNWSKENENKKIFAQYGYPQRFGFPVFIILNDKGERIHTQNSEYLEDGKKSYNIDKVIAFLEQWTPNALAPASYGK